MKSLLALAAAAAVVVAVGGCSSAPVDAAAEGQVAITAEAEEPAVVCEPGFDFSDVELVTDAETLAAAAEDGSSDGSGITPSAITPMGPPSKEPPKPAAGTQSVYDDQLCKEFYGSMCQKQRCKMWFTCPAKSKNAGQTYKHFSNCTQGSCQCASIPQATINRVCGCK